MQEQAWPFVQGNRVLEIERASGNKLYTKDGQEILDAAGGAIVTNIGAGRTEVAEAMAKASERLGYIVPIWTTPERESLIERLRKAWLPGDLSRVFLGTGGSDANDAAIRLARYHHIAKGQKNKWKIVSREISYHGATLSTMGISGHPARREGLESLMVEMPKVPTPYPLRDDKPADGSNEDPGLIAARSLESCIEREGADTIAAFIGEPIIGSSGGAIVPPDNYWPRIQRICRENNILLIVDEVMVGFGRVGSRFAHEQFGIEPDIMVAGKGLAGGYAPLGGVYARPSVAEPLVGSQYAPMFYTFAGHPAACAAADTVLEIMEREALVDRVSRLGPVFDEKLNRVRQHEHVAEVRGRGFFWGVEIVKDRTTLKQFPKEDNITSRVVAAGLSKGVFYYPGGTGEVRDIICIGPSFTTTEDEMGQIVEVLLTAIDGAVART